MEPRVAAIAATGVLGLIGQCGGDAERILAAAQLEERTLGQPDAKLSLPRYCALFEHAARQTGLANFGLQFGLSYRTEQLGALGALMLAAPTVGAALGYLCAYFPAVQDHSTLAMAPEGPLLRLTYQIKDGRITARAQDAELSLGMFIAALRRALGAGWGPEEVQFEHLRAAERSAQEKLLHAPVSFAAPTNAILLRRADLAAPMPGADPARLPALKTQLAHLAARHQPADFLGLAAQAIRDGFAAGDTSIEATATRLHLSRATLYRRLGQAGCDYTALTEQIRRSLALLYVPDPHIPLTDIAATLGYSELSAFSRAFKRWTGRSPAALRRKQDSSFL
jgi:AraC-like DNA-binding protein